MEWYDNHKNEELESQETALEKKPKNNHGAKMLLMHLVPMILLFSFYDFFNQPGNKIWLYGFILVMIILHLGMMSTMGKHKQQK